MPASSVVIVSRSCYDRDVVSDRPALGALVQDRAGDILAGWLVRFERSPLRFRRGAKAVTHTAQVSALVESLVVAASGGAADLQMGSDATRELERSASFLGAQFASEGATGYDVAAMLLELRDVIAGMVEADDAAALTRLFEWLTVVALDAFAASGLQSLRERVADQLEVGTPVVEILPRVPAVIFVGAPNASVVDNLLARAWMLAVGTGAPCLILDCGGLAEPAERHFEGGYQKFLDQVAGSTLQVVLATARRPLRERVAAATTGRGVAFQHFDRLDSAVSHVIERSGQLLIKRT